VGRFVRDRARARTREFAIVVATPTSARPGRALAEALRAPRPRSRGINRFTALALARERGVHEADRAIAEHLEYAHNGDGTRALTADLAAYVIHGRDRPRAASPRPRHAGSHGGLPVRSGGLGLQGLGQDVRAERVELAPAAEQLKCEPELADALRRTHDSIRPGYHLNKRHWNTLTLDGSLTDTDRQRT
jgi:hypothetical protein